ncbi:hypothetical protein LR48_Vigan01g327000 [Vigna angularis]|uniref:Uncharacterized protein n=1 Tax=Phaseolus angularis TaxID=3914 RepID=A0A0L9TU56_PHAAN|nr:hypothetical protein LR48_Vigan01g327000 [Vigna angularis]
MFLIFNNELMVLVSPLSMFFYDSMVLVERRIDYNVLQSTMRVLSENKWQYYLQLVLHCLVASEGLFGAWVGLKCHSHGRKWKGKGSVVARGVTDEFGEFIIDLPSQLHAVPNLEKVCSVKIDRIPKRSFCRAVGVKKQKELSLYSFGNGIRTYNAGNIRI